ncbi:hypothetical protein E2C01_061672 [Portunus trituberculatus]|uniref:Uncharacterized protein n=1 Tax=Portunus trituberculatus TaxID=210409 RepID=A0A5B7HD15_PORTR|nr:hypothetical protein [Portunus trituberculatus]
MSQGMTDSGGWAAQRICDTGRKYQAVGGGVPPPATTLSFTLRRHTHTTTHSITLSTHNCFPYVGGRPSPHLPSSRVGGRSSSSSSSNNSTSSSSTTTTTTTTTTSSPSSLSFNCSSRLPPEGSGPRCATSTSLRHPHLGHHRHLKTST